MNIADVAKWQKLLLWIILAQIILIIVAVGLAATGSLGAQPAAPGAGSQAASAGATAAVLAIQVVSVGLSIASVVVIILLTGALGWGVAARVISALLMFCPIISLITLLVINAKATGALKAAGYKVGLMGAQGPPD